MNDIDKNYLSATLNRNSTLGKEMIPILSIPTKKYYEERNLMGVPSTKIISTIIQQRDIQNEIKDFLIKLQKKIPEIKAVYYNEKKYFYSLYLFIEKDDINIIRKIYDVLNGLYEKYIDYDFDLMIYPEECLSDFQDMNKLI